MDTQDLTYRQLKPAGGGPSARETAGAGVSLADGSAATFLMGGHGVAEEDNEVWAKKQDNDTWERIAAGGRAPRARSGHAVVWAEGVGLVVFGGLSHEKGGYVNDVALLRAAPEGLAWESVCATGTEIPCGRDKHAAAVVPAGPGALPRLLTFGGFGVLPKDEEDEEDEEEGEEARDGDAAGGDAAGGDAAGGDAGDDANAAPGEEKGEAGRAEKGEGEGEGEDGDAARGPSVDLGWFDDLHELDLSTWRFTFLRQVLIW